jgi:hypothetical protein
MNKMNLITHSLGNKTIMQRPEDGYMNATAMCKATDKLFADYNRLSTTTAFLSALSSDMGIPISELIQTVKGGKGQQGTWVHPHVAMHLAQWLSPEFAVKVSRWIFEWMGQGKKPDPEFIMIHKSVLDNTGKALVWMGDYGVTSQPYYGGAVQPLMVDGRPQLPDSITIPMDDWIDVCDSVVALSKIFGEALSRSIQNNYAPLPMTVQVPTTLASKVSHSTSMIYAHTFRQMKANRG